MTTPKNPPLIASYSFQFNLSPAIKYATMAVMNKVVIIIDTAMETGINSTADMVHKTEANAYIERFQSNCWILMGY